MDLHYIAFGIHQVNFRFENDLDKIVFNVKLSRPGIFIGRQGKDFYQTQKELVKLLGADVEINLIEFSPCSNFQGVENICDLGYVWVVKRLQMISPNNVQNVVEKHLRELIH